MSGLPVVLSKCADPPASCEKAHTHKLTLTHSEVRASLAPGCVGLTYGLPGLLNVAWGLATSYIVH